MIQIIMGIVLGILDYIKIGFTGLGEILLVGYLFLNVGKAKYDKNIQKPTLLLIIFVVIATINFLFGVINSTLAVKVILKWVIILVEFYLLYKNITIDSTKNIKLITIFFMFSQIMSTVLELKERLNFQNFLHYCYFIFPILILYKYKCTKKVKILFFVIAFLHIFYGAARTVMAIFAIMVIYDLIKKVIIEKGKKSLKEIFVIIILIPFISIVMMQYIENKVTSKTVSNIERNMLIQAAIFDIKSRPMLGVGAGNFSSYAITKGYFNIRSETFPVHNIYLELFAEFGIIGLTIYLIILYDLRSCLFYKDPNNAVAYMFLFLIFKYMFQTYSSSGRFLLSFLLALLYFYKKMPEGVVAYEKNVKVHN